MNPKELLDRFSTHLKDVIAKSISFAASSGHSYVGLEHFVIFLAEEKGSVGAEILLKSKAKIDGVFQLLVSLPEVRKGLNSEITTATIPEMNLDAKTALEKAMLTAYERKHNYVGTEHLLYAIAKMSTSTNVEQIFAALEINQKTITHHCETILNSISKFQSTDNLQEIGAKIEELVADSPAQNKKIPSSSRPKETALDFFTRDLTQNAEKSDPVVGREREIERIIHILARRNKNNPVLVGEPGVGKTAIVEGLARRIAEGSVPEILKKKKILSLDLPLLLSGTIYRGEFESRLKQITDEMRERHDCVLFIDELHNIIGAGSGQGTMDAANILKPALARGDLRCIGATTIDEFKRHIGSDPALERRFQMIHIDEPSTEETIEIINGIKKYYENFHIVQITPEAVKTAVELSTKYVHDNFLPDKAIDLIDEAAAAVRTRRPLNLQEKKLSKLETEMTKAEIEKAKAIGQEDLNSATKLAKQITSLKKQMAVCQKKINDTPRSERTRVNMVDIAKVLAHKLGIAANTLLEDDLKTAQNLSHRLSTYIFGQDQALMRLERVLTKSTILKNSGAKPLASILIVGPSGTGKTETAKILAREFFHDEKAFIRLDMGEFSEQHSVSKLLGSPAGYVGYRERNRFLDDLRARPYSIVLFDEIDKAHPDVRKLLLQILDSGEMTDSAGKKTIFKHAIVVLTANIGTEYFKSNGIGFGGNAEKNKSDTEENIKTKIREELGANVISRISEVLIYRPITRTEVEKIVRREVEKLSREISAAREISVAIDRTAIDALIQLSLDPDTGARHIEKRISDILLDTISPALTEMKNKKIVLTHTGGKFDIL
ncbi:MAG TPA: ATP-dependent Clp protease ATP-binding subunit [Candidatus Magasanikbacteria bacterium]|nr:ATP-dependent Clp protease ATP-binding subunit [Candidatus Magasanikbacteria bacterium]